jgi:hypothetical protein
VALLVMSGCGDSGTSKAATTTVAAVTKSDFISQANALCQTMKDRANAIPDPGSDPNTFADALDEVVGITDETLAKLRALPTPAGDEATLEAIFTKVDALGADYRQLASALRAGDAATAEQLQATVAADLTAANTAANDYGLTVCGS